METRKERSAAFLRKFGHKPTDRPSRIVDMFVNDVRDPRHWDDSTLNMVGRSFCRDFGTAVGEAFIADYKGLYWDFYDPPVKDDPFRWRPNIMGFANGSSWEPVSLFLSRAGQARAKGAAGNLAKVLQYWKERAAGEEMPPDIHVSERKSPDHEGARIPVEPWLVEFAQFFVERRFFTTFGKAGDVDSVARGISSAFLDEWGERPSQSRNNVEQLLLALDTKRVYYETFDADAAPGSDVYVEVLENIARISDGALEFASTTETWSRGAGTIRSYLNGALIEIPFTNYDGWLDESVFISLHRHVRETTGLNLSIVALDDCFEALLLTPAERAAIAARPAWHFDV